MVQPEGNVRKSRIRQETIQLEENENGILYETVKKTGSPYSR